MSRETYNKDIYELKRPLESASLNSPKTFAFHVLLHR